jgi:glycosyltransferase involved in cell wall biosynthesis
MIKNPITMSSPPAADSLRAYSKLPSAGSRSSRLQQPPGEARARITTSELSPAPIICLCHLSWDWVWQRPQQYLSRFAKQHAVLFVETHRVDGDEVSTRMRAGEGCENVTVLQILLPARIHDNLALADEARRQALAGVLAGELRGKFQRPILWFYDPMTVRAYVGHLNERLVVYDCMDELSQFKGAAPELIGRERELVRQADVVFCGGRKMREKRLPLNSNTHFFGTGVDIQHFGRAISSDLPVAPEIAALSKPVLGYFGVIDERIDYALLAKLADAHPGWSIAMVGPTAKVDPRDFPQRPNLHWLGGRKYADLPAITKGFSVCLMPFAKNAATEYINPTKALEYMATGTPVVSTDLYEVRANFGEVARVATTHEEFVTWCLCESAAPTQERIDRGMKLAADNTWEANVARMEKHIIDALHARANAAVRQTSPVTIAGTRLAYV